jgi:hypothetical protein
LAAEQSYVSEALSYSGYIGEDQRGFQYSDLRVFGVTDKEADVFASHVATSQTKEAAKALRSMIRFNVTFAVYYSACYWSIIFSRLANC